ncbi:MAG TPA: aromatic ring-hydroxylating dioxygenase subunit alpha [Caulobacteraceae bacterium]|nr:aromatic ring-hydroxylating dioxygenase subunit alpha [Caulobacteraceae bacterium]
MNAKPDPQSSSIERLIAGRAEGCALPQGFYVRDDVFARDLDLLLGGWTFIGHESEIPEAGDWITGGFGRESAIIVRGEDGEVRALANVCRHRGSRVCIEAKGHAVTLTCPYHAWSYRLDGSLRAAREMPEGFDPATHGLKSLPVALIGGLVFVSFGEAPPSLAQAAPALTAMAAAYGWDRARIAERRSYSVAANWKLALENYHECYHCGPAHPEFSVLHALARPSARRLRSAEESRADRAGGITVADFEAWGPRSDGAEVVRVMRSELAANVRTGSREGGLVAPLMGPDDGACVFAELGYLSAFLAYADHGIAYRFIPRGVLQTEMEVIWLVDGDAREDADYDITALTWLWDVTSLADKRIIERNQAGVLSRFYEPGPFSLMEPGARQYVDRYLADLAAAIA